MSYTIEQLDCAVRTAVAAERKQCARMHATLWELSNGYKYPTAVVMLAREALGISAAEADRAALTSTEQP